MATLRLRIRKLEEKNCELPLSRCGESRRGQQRLDGGEVLIRLTKIDLGMGAAGNPETIN
jgi:hypothetical protein